MAEPARVRGTAPRPSNRSVLGRASDAAPFKPYVYRGEKREPDAVTAARLRHQAVDDEIDRQRAEMDAELTAKLTAKLAAFRAARREPDVGPGPEWYRERAAEDADDLTRFDDWA